MKNIIILISILIAFNARAGVNHVKLQFTGEGPFNKSKQFNVIYCKDVKCKTVLQTTLHERLAAEDLVVKALEKDIRKGHYIRRSEVDDCKSYPVDLVDVIKHLSEDYTNGDGEQAWPKEEVIEVMTYLRRNSGNTVIYNADVMTNYRGGTGIEKNVLIYNAQTAWTSVIYRQTYAE